MSSTYYTDSPIDDKRQDQFERAKFAERLASICTGNNGSSLVVGVYGKWGEGKTSLLNMVSQSLPNDVVRVNFNPWFFRDETQLVNAFFKALANALGRTIESKREELVRTLSDYEAAIGLLEDIPHVGIGAKILRLLGGFIKKPRPLSVEAAKERLDDIIVESRQNIVVFVDDIDRLDVREMAAVFKLVKLLANFPRTTYILSFDIELVATMLAPQYGGVVPDSGYMFLEKIIQVPLTLPKARISALGEYVRTTIQEACNLGLLVDDRFESAFVDAVIPLLGNPRKALRLSNAVRFSHTLVDGEVNACDFLLIETIRVSLPDFYFFIHDHKELFLDNYLDFDLNERESNREVAYKKVEKAIKRYPEDVKKHIRRLICELFPRFVWIDPAEAGRQDMEIWMVQKRICSPKYIDKYFTYSLQKSEIPDKHFDTLYLHTEGKSVETLIEEYTKDFACYSVDDVIFKLVYHRKQIHGRNAMNLAQALAGVSDAFKEKEAFDFGGTFRLAGMTLQALVENLTGNDKFEAAKTIIEKCQSMEFAAELVARFVMPESEESKRTIFVGAEATEIKAIYVNRVKSLIEKSDFFSAIRDDNMLRLLIWWDDVNRNELRQYLDHVLAYDSSAPLRLLKIFTPTVYSSNGKDTKKFKADFGDGEYERIARVVGAKAMFEGLTLLYGDKSTLESIDHIGVRDAIDDMTLVGIFQRRYLASRNAVNSTVPLGEDI